MDLAYSVPFKSQLGVGSDAHRNDCLIACAIMLKGAYGYPLEDTDAYYKRIGIVGDGLLGPSAIIPDLEKIKIPSSWFTGLSLSDLDLAVLQNKPVIALVKYNELYGMAATPYNTFPHFVVVVNSDVGNIIMHDPYRPDGANVKVARATFLKAWTDVGTNPAAPNAIKGALIPKFGVGALNDVYWMKVTAKDGLNVRKAPIVGAKITAIPYNSLVSVVSKSLGWVEINYPVYGWCSGAFLQDTAQIPPTPSVFTFGEHCIDVSLYQEDICWSSLPYDVTRTYIKAVDGVGMFEDPKFQTNWKNAKRINITRSPYSFYWPASYWKAQFDLLDKAVGGDWGNAGTVVDLEAMSLAKSSYGQSKGLAIPSAGAAMLSDLLSYLKAIETASGYKPLIYTGFPDYQFYLTGTKLLDGYQFILAAYPEAKSILVGDKYWDLNNYSYQSPKLPDGLTIERVKYWQFSGNGKVSGITPIVDLNIELIVK